MPQDDVRNRYEDNVLHFGELVKKLPRIPAASQPHAVCSRCAAIRLDHLDGENTPEGEKFYRHSSTYFDLLASTSQKCPMCLLMLQALAGEAGTGGLKNALTVFHHKESKDRPITLRAVRRPEDENEDNAKEDDKIRAIEVRIETWWGSRGRCLLPVYALPGSETATKWNVRAGIPIDEMQKWERVVRWLKVQINTLAGKRTRLPTRLIDVGLSPTETDHVRVIGTSSLTTAVCTETYRYIALSYRWGEGNRLLTTKSTYAQHQTSIQIEIVPKTIRDAIHVTRHLGIRYLWVDALCIVQDDEQDWTKEAARMGDIYMNALCTIAAHAADHADCGFLKEAMQREVVVACGGRQFVNENGGSGLAGKLGIGARELKPGVVDYAKDMAIYEEFASHSPTQIEDKLQGLSLGLSSQEGMAGTSRSKNLTNFTPGAFLVSKGTYARFHLDKTELSSRGWVMQERILSPRTIHFGKMGSMYFETRNKVEHIEIGEERGYRPFSGLRDALGALDELQGDEDEGPSLSTIRGTLVPFKVDNKVGDKVTVMKTPDELVYRGWYELVTKYSGCLLTKSKDKMVALSGIVRKCQQVNKDRYISGIWLHPDYFHICLLWLAVEKDPLVTTTDAGAVKHNGMF
ncbi:Heterokaryon incompatibility protein (HET) domain containing protein [Naviculisporaceae sp. PSN 640]